MSFHGRGGVCALLALALAGCPSEPTATARPVLTFDQPSIDFGSVAPGVSVAKELRLSNTGIGTLLVAGVKFTDDERGAFKVEDVPTQLLEGAAATVRVTYRSADAEGADTASLVFLSNTEGKPGSETAVPLVASTRAPACDDRVKNGTETDTDCGGGCPGCRAGGRCGSNLDCDASVTCFSGVCTGCNDAAQCRPGQQCRDGACAGCATTAECSEGQECKNGLCTDCPNEGEPIDTTRDPRHCGACNNACPAPVHAAAACRASKCTRAPCEAGYWDLDGSATLGCEAQCSGMRCTTPAGIVTLTDPPLPETGLQFQGAVPGASGADQVQTSSRFTNVGTSGPAQAPANVTQAGGGWKNQAGFASQF